MAPRRFRPCSTKEDLTMENIRLVLIVSLMAVILLIYQAWVQDVSDLKQKNSIDMVEAMNLTKKSSDVEIPSVPTSPVSVDQGLAQQVKSGTEAQSKITVETDVLQLEISTKGGIISSAWLVNYPISPNEKDQKVRLFKPDMPNLFIAQSGLIGLDGASLPTHDAVFASTKQNYKLSDDQHSISVRLDWKNNEGIAVNKYYILNRGSYLVETRQEIVNNSGRSVNTREYIQLQRSDLNDPNASRFISTYTGGVYYSPEDKYKKVPFTEITERKLNRQVTDGWVAMMQHYFLSAWIPPKGLEETFYTNIVDGNRYIIGMFSPVISVSSNTSHTFNNGLYIGPKLQDTLESVAPGLELTVDYGWLTVIAQPIHWLLNKIYDIVGNWGWSIIVLTILIKLAFYKLSETSYKSMANMRQLTPRLAALKDRYGDDKERLNQAMMELYKTEKINPLGGCLPIFVQIPVFIALYWVLLESVELRQAPFILWIDNLSAPDPYYVLPLIMGLSMYIQSKLNPAPPDPMQAKIMMSLPFIFTVFFAFFPSGLVLYWTVNNILSIAQQWYITNAIDKAAEKRKR